MASQNDDRGADLSSGASTTKQTPPLRCQSLRKVQAVDRAFSTWALGWYEAKPDKKGRLTWRLVRSGTPLAKYSSNQCWPENQPGYDPKLYREGVRHGKPVFESISEEDFSADLERIAAEAEDAVREELTRGRP